MPACQHPGGGCAGTIPVEFISVLPSILKPPVPIAGSIGPGSRGIFRIGGIRVLRRHCGTGWESMRDRSRSRSSDVSYLVGAHGRAHGVVWEVRGLHKCPSARTAQRLRSLEPSRSVVHHDDRPRWQSDQKVGCLTKRGKYT